MNPEGLLKPSDTQCHRCGQVFRYRKDREQHQELAHGIVAAKPVQNDRPLWDSTSEADVWTRPRTHQSAWSLPPPKKDWSYLPTPAEAAAASKNRGATANISKRNSEIPSASSQPTDRPENSDPFPYPEPRTQDINLNINELRLQNLKTTFDTSTSSSSTSKSIVSKSSMGSHDQSSSLEATLEPGSCSPSEKMPQNSYDSTVSAAERRSVEGDSQATRYKSRDYFASSRETHPAHSWRCGLCKGEWVDYVSYKEHVNKTGHARRCRICREVFLSRDALMEHIDAKDHHDPLTSEGRRIDQIRHERGYKKNRSLHLNEPLDASAASNQLRSFSPTRNFTNKNQEKVEEDLIDLAWPASSKAKSLSRPESISRDTSSNASSIPRQRTQLTVVANASESDEPTMKSQSLHHDSPVSPNPSSPPAPQSPKAITHSPRLAKTNISSLSGYIDEIENGNNPRVPLGAIALYKAAAECSSAHDFVYGRYMHDMVSCRNLQQRYRENAWPFICPNEENCGGVFRSMVELVRHWEIMDCVKLEWAEGVVRELGERLGAQERRN